MPIPDSQTLMLPLPLLRYCADSKEHSKQEVVSALAKEFSLSDGEHSIEQESTPEELLEAGYKQLRVTLAADLLQQVKKGSPAFFERLVVELLVRMGYGGTREDACQVLGKSGDGGIDGIINGDRLVLDVIYLQAKRWEDDAGKPEIQKFAGALAGHKANKGVFLTTSSYSKEARVYAS